eukprot:TRINITY_DN13069_c0_g1_i1.p1 TRINITY_DN13069_c0_g1~~TRINITY_DN13069_c0_g1_i1.p1  ORF type:complete len:126 (+),score=23.19 TRINITY_DN13069_c0_g1_i1:52-429(+)
MGLRFSPWDGRRLGRALEMQPVLDARAIGQNSRMGKPFEQKADMKWIAALLLILLGLTLCIPQDMFVDLEHRQPSKSYLRYIPSSSRVEGSKHAEQYIPTHCGDQINDQTTAAVDKQSSRTACVG